MMDMGFWPDVQKIMGALPPDRQTLLFSATLPGEIQRMAKEMLRSPRYVQVGTQGGAARTIDHQMVKVESGEKIDWLATFAKRESDGPVLVFVRRKVDGWQTRHLVARAFARRRCTPTGRSRNGCRRWKGSALGKIPCWWPPTSRCARLDIEASRTSSISKCRIRRTRYVHRSTHGTLGRIRHADPGVIMSSGRVRCGGCNWNPGPITTHRP
jgi:hypothetical protein